ncbi:hypothetical protein SNE35_30680 [Paucibacter sp. R3-3]|uniref:Cell envelope biogenesis protein TolA n=1 Tax=Roseateles agri TaxID=3098619 RepID=A0ABU5DTR9_9BURK|nr:hypothetical protein [Paucibacter sp. R3-3]MDY0748904.1 hypothetical protein [Paucibacter sp. R3-3]
MKQTQLNLRASLFTAALLALPIGQALAMDHSEYAAGKSRIEDAYKADKAGCKSLSGNGKDVCMEEAKAKEKVAKAELEHDYTGKESDWVKVLKTRAETTYDVAKERCDDQAGNNKDVCVKEAKAAKESALADAKASKKIHDARADAADQKRDADYKVATEKCDALAGDAKSSCIAQAKANFGKS